MNKIIKLTLLTSTVLTSLSGCVFAYQKTSSDNTSSTLKPTIINSGAAESSASTNVPAVAPASRPRTNTATQINIAAPKKCTLGKRPTVASPNVSLSNPGVNKSPVNRSFYTIFGNDLSQIRTQMYECSPVVDDGKRFAAENMYSINWAANYTISESGVCTIKDVSVGVNVSQLYPQLQAGPSATTTTTNNWNKFIANLQTHENGHSDLVYSKADALYSQLKSYPSSDCSSINSRLNSVANNVISELEAAQESYDARTNHGATQGAVL